jgi:hypothetical protein
LLGAKKDEEGNKDEQWIAEESDKTKDKCHGLPDPSCDLGGSSVRKSHCEERTKHAPAIHRKRWDQVEQDQDHIYRSQLGEHAHTWALNLFQVLNGSRMAEKENQHNSNDHVDQRASDGDNQFLPRLIGHSLKSGHPANREQRNVGRGNPESSCRQNVAKFMQQDAAKER